VADLTAGSMPLLSGCQGYGSPCWGTYRQIGELRGRVRRGERGTPVVFWKWLDGQDEEGKDRKVPLRGYCTVFRLDQTDGLEHKRLDEMAKPKPSQFSPIERAEALVKGYPEPPSIRTDRTAAD